MFLYTLLLCTRFILFIYTHYCIKLAPQGVIVGGLRPRITFLHKIDYISFLFFLSIKTNLSIYHDIRLHTSYNSMTTIPLPDLSLFNISHTLFTLPPKQLIQSTNNKFFKFYLFNLWFIYQFKHIINHHDFNLIIQSIIFSFHHNIHNTFFTHLNHIKFNLHPLFII